MKLNFIYTKEVRQSPGKRKLDAAAAALKRSNDGNVDPDDPIPLLDPEFEANQPVQQTMEVSNVSLP